MDGLFPVILRFVTIEDNIVYNLTVNQDDIIRYVKVMRTLRLLFLCFFAHFGTFSVITLVLQFITSWFMADT